ncbi:MAG: hypothetical protein KIS74_06670 [Burkholderiales bacterium]|nr:hypothetical protein [Burkholderiales bacterium]
MDDSRRRRQLILAVAGILAAPFAASSRPAAPTEPARIVVLLVNRQPTDDVGNERKWFAEEFAKHGLRAGADIEVTTIPCPYIGEGLEEALRKAVSVRPKVILSQSNPFLVKRQYLPVTRDIPLVVWAVDDGGEESIEALNRRGENVTGALYSYLELVTLRFGLMKQLKPGARRIGMVIDEVPAEPLKQELFRQEKPALLSMAGKLGMDFSLVELPPGSSPAVVVDALRRERVEMAEIRCCWSRELWAELAKNGILASSVGAGTVEQGALLGGWSVGYVPIAVRLAARVVRGARAADIPAERSMQYGLAINLRTARMLGLTVPPSMVLRADRVFQ